MIKERTVEIGESIGMRPRTQLPPPPAQDYPIVPLSSPIIFWGGNTVASCSDTPRRERCSLPVSVYLPVEGQQLALLKSRVHSLGQLPPSRRCETIIDGLGLSKPSLEV